MRSKASAAFLRLDELAEGKLSEVIDIASAVAERLGFDDGYETGKKGLSRYVGWDAAPYVPEELLDGWAYEVAIHELVRCCERSAAQKRRIMRRRAPQRRTGCYTKVSKVQKVRA